MRAAEQPPVARDQFPAQTVDVGPPDRAGDIVGVEQPIAGAREAKAGRAGQGVVAADDCDLDVSEVPDVGRSMRRRGAGPRAARPSGLDAQEHVAIGLAVPDREADRGRGVSDRAGARRGGRKRMDGAGSCVNAVSIV